MSNIKANRTFTIWRRYGWILTFIIAFGGLYEHKLGLIVPFFIMPGLIITSLFKGRYWCGNICPHGSFFDSVLLKCSRNENMPPTSRSKVLMIIIFLIFGVILSNRVYNVFSNFLGMTLLDRFGFIFVTTYLLVLLISIPLGVFFSPRTWCQFCPMGTMQKICGEIGKVLIISKDTNKKLTIIDKDACLNCGKCSRVCPMQLKPYLEFNNNRFENKDCIKCKTCVMNCPKKILDIR